MNIVFNMCLPRDEASVPVVRRLCRGSLQSLGVKDDCLHDIELVVTEACTNVLKHAAGTRNQYDVEVAITEEDCSIKVTDNGGGFDHANHADVVNPSAEGGRGIHLMRFLVDDLHFMSGPDTGTEVLLTKRLEHGEGSLLARLSAHSRGGGIADPVA